MSQLKHYISIKQCKQINNADIETVITVEMSVKIICKCVVIDTLIYFHRLKYNQMETVEFKHKLKCKT